MDKNRFKQKANEAGIQLSENQLESCLRYADLMLEWNQRSNITAITEAGEVEDKHFLDSLYLAAQPEVQGDVADIGTGAGFPGVVLKIFKPDIKLTLVESNQKKVAFLQSIKEGLNLEYEVLSERAEELGRAAYRERFDLVTARAVAALPVLAEYCLPLVKQGGWFVPMKGRLAEELDEARNAIGVLGGSLLEERPYHLPDGSERKLYLIEKVKPSDQRYPRNTARIKKKPL